MHLAPGAGVDIDYEGVAMKTSPRIIVAFVCTVVLAAAAAATADPGDVVAKVPFAFTIGKTQLPQDTYRIARFAGKPDLLLIRSMRHGLIINGQRDGSSNRDGTPRLVFHRYGDQYFLREIWMPSNVEVSLPQSREEREAAGRIARLATPDQAVVAVPLE